MLAALKPPGLAAPDSLSLERDTNPANDKTWWVFMGQKQRGTSPLESLVSMNKLSPVWGIMQIWILYKRIFWVSFILSQHQLFQSRGILHKDAPPCTFVTSLLPAAPGSQTSASNIKKAPTGITRWDQEQQELLFPCSSVKPKVINLPVKILLIDETQLLAGKTPLFSIINIQDTWKKGRDLAEGKVQLLFH